MMRPSPRAVVMGASAGAVEALQAILPHLPGDYALPVMIVVHVPPDKQNMMVDLMQPKCAMKVCEAEDTQAIKPGTIYFAPPDYHLLVEKDDRLSLSSEEPVLFSRPSIDILFETAADAYGCDLIGVVLSGASSDGANGLKAVVENGGQGLVQRPETAPSRTMPQAALDAAKGSVPLSLEQIADYLKKAGASA